MIKLMVLELFYFFQVMVDMLLGDVNVVVNVLIIGGYLYGGVFVYLMLVWRLGKDVWMIEYFLDFVNKVDNKMFWQISIDDVIVIVKEIYDGFMLGQYNVYVYWWLVNFNDVQFIGLIGLDNKFIYFGIGLKYFVYFICLGYVCYDMIILLQKGVCVFVFGMFVGVIDNKVVVVLVNENSMDVILMMLINFVGCMVISLMLYWMMVIVMFEQQVLVVVSGNMFMVMLLVKSIIMLVNQVLLRWYWELRLYIGCFGVVVVVFISVQ